MAQSSIEWTEVTWNPVTGCDKVSAGCKFCYAEVMSRRLKAMNVDKYRNGFNITLHPESLQEPYQWKKPRVVFVNSMSDPIINSLECLEEDETREFCAEIGGRVCGNCVKVLYAIDE